MKPANYDLPYYTILAKPCGCVTSTSRGHTNIKFCAPCRSEHFALLSGGEQDNSDLVEANLDLVGGYTP
jgi:hypothetical protein